MHYYSHHIGDFDRGTRHLSRIERSIYLDLIFQYYETEGALTLDVSALCRKIVARTEEEKAAVLAVLDEFFHETPNGWYHDRCEEEIAAYRTKAGKASSAGKASAAARAERRKTAMGESATGVERRGNEKATNAQQMFNERSTDVESKFDLSSTQGQLESNTKATNQEPITSNQDKTPHTPQGGIGEVVKPTRVSRGIALKTFLADCKAKEQRPIRDYEPLWNYTRTAGLPDDFVALAWVEFCRRFGAGGVKETKVQIDWRKTFRNYVEGNFLKLWAIGPEGYFLTTQGKQAQTVAEAA
jgi:uncharacterized protein YdaU (DUF1376 family)